MYNQCLGLPSIALKAGRARAAVIIRVSTAEQASEGRNGLERQRREAERIVRAKNYEVIETVEIIDVSGASVLLAPEIQNLIKRVENHDIQVVVCSEMSRLIRPDDLTSFAFLDVFKRNNVCIDCGGTSHDLSSPEGFLAGGIQALLGGHERMMMLRKMIQSKEASRAAGHCPSSNITLPHGLIYDRTANVFRYSEEVWQMQEAFRLIDEEGLRNLCEIARRVGMHHRTVRNLLSNKSYIGIREYISVRDQSSKVTKAGGRQGDRPKILREPDKVIRARIIPVEAQAVTDDRFERVQKVLVEIADRHARVVAPGKGCNLLTSLGYCGRCGQPLYTATSSRKGPNGVSLGYYLCRSQHGLFKSRSQPCSQGWMPKHDVDELAASFARLFMADREFLAAVLNHAQSKRDSVVRMSSMPSAIRDKLSDLDRRDKRILDGVESGVLSLAEAKERRLRLAEERSGLLQTLERAEKRLETEDTTLGGMIGRLAEGTAAWDAAKTPQERKKLLMAMFMEIYLQGLSITAFRLAPSLVGIDSGEWAWIADVAVVLPEPFRIHPMPVKTEIPDGHRACSRCHDVLPLHEFYGARPACKRCTKVMNHNYYLARVGRGKPTE